MGHIPPDSNWLSLCKWGLQSPSFSLPLKWRSYQKKRHLLHPKKKDVDSIQSGVRVGNDSNRRWGAEQLSKLAGLIPHPSISALHPSDCPLSPELQDPSPSAAVRTMLFTRGWESEVRVV